MPLDEPQTESALCRVAVILPAWEPGAELPGVVGALSACGFAAVVVVDDGSGSSAQAVFAEIEGMAGAHVVHHAVNLGKGRALKSGFDYVLTQIAEAEWVVTADADGQHRLEDIVRVARAACATPQRVVLGVRSFAREVPLRSMFGNLVTREIFFLVTGARLSDTQTGLRAIPRARLAELLLLEGERYEYEMTVLAYLCRRGERPMEVAIATVYVDGNRSSHFSPIRDSMRIYFVLARFYASALLSAAVDLLGFSLAYAATGDLLFSVGVGRLSSLVNFTLNRRFVFISRGPVLWVLSRYFLLAIGIAALSYLSIRAMVALRWNVFAAKVTIDVALSLISFSVQRTFVFLRSKTTE